MNSRRLILTMVPVCALVAVVAATSVPSGDASAQQEPCNAWDVDYALSAKLQLSDTPMGAGNGTYNIGPGRTTLRFQNQNGKPGGAVEMRSYNMRESFTIDSKTLAWTTHVVNDSTTTAPPDACGVLARGQLEGQSLRWNTSIAGYRTDGSLTCDGNLCGNFGAPPPGRSDLHIEPHSVEFKPFEFSSDMKTFTMPNTFVAKSSMPKQTAHIALAGRETRRTCVRATPCK